MTASPDPGFSEDLEGLCVDLGLRYYRSPRNLGIPPNVISGSSGPWKRITTTSSSQTRMFFLPSLARRAGQTPSADPTIGSVTAWSNNASIFSLPNSDPDPFLRNQEVVTWLAESIDGSSGRRRWTSRQVFRSAS